MILAALAVGLVSMWCAGCGARTELDVTPPERSDAGRRPDGGRVDAGPPPPSGCSLGPLLGPYVSDAPSFAYSLAEHVSPEGEAEYVVGYSNGWPPDDRAAIMTLSLDLTRRTRDVMLPGTWERVGVAPSGDHLWAIAEDDNALDALEMTPAGGTWVIHRGPQICVDCFVGWTALRPAIAEDRALVGYRTAAGSSFLAVVDRSDAVLATAYESESAPRAIEYPGGVILITSLAEPGLLRVRFLDDALGPVRETDIAMYSTGEPPAPFTRESEVFLVGRPALDGPLAVFRVPAMGLPGLFEIPVDPTLALGTHVALSRGNVAVLIEGIDGDTIVVTDEGGAVVMDPTPLTVETGSYRHSPHIAPHPEGFAIVYGGWEESGFYGIYGRLLRCFAR